MSPTAYICDGIDWLPDSEALKILGFYKDISLLAVDVGILPYARRLYRDSDEPGPHETVEARTHRLSSAYVDVVVAYINPPVKEIVYDLDAANDEGLPIIILNDLGIWPKEIDRDSYPKIISVINFVDKADALEKLNKVLTEWKLNFMQKQNPRDHSALRYR